MKKIIIVFALLAISAGLSFASENYFQVATMIDKKLSEQKVCAIQSLSSGLTEVEKGLLYQQYESKPGLPFVCNLLLGCGIGSYIQGDAKYGTIFLCSELCGAGLMLLGSAQMLDKAYIDGEISTFGTTMLYGGAAITVVAKILECIRPFTYSEQYNQRLNSALNGGVSLAAVPTITNNGIGAAVVGTVKL